MRVAVTITGYAEVEDDAAMIDLENQLYSNVDLEELRIAVRPVEE